MITVSLRFCLTILAALVLNTVLMIVFAFKYLHLVNLPQPRCLHPLSFTPTQIEAAQPLDATGVSI